ncbi:phospholipase D-like domain-containing protein [Achromobacter sp. 413638]|uniref:phospholipase D-like domain-containing protein n=1 Tax=Achromobacter sp. 413638 TaxID=3342385 RepID=UPI00370A1697
MTAPINVLAIGDNRGNLAFADSATGAVLGTVTLSRGYLSAPGLAWNGILYAGESTTQSTTLLHAYDPAVSPVADGWANTVSVSGSVDATPVVMDGVLWFATSQGNLISVSSPQSASPVLGTPVYVCGSTAPGKVSALLSTGDHRTLVLVTAKGLFGAAVSGTTATVLWSTLGGVDLTVVAPALLGNQLFVASGSTLYEVTLAPNGIQAPKAIEAEAAIGVLIPLDQDRLLMGSVNGAYVLLDTVNEQSLGRFTLSSSAGAVPWTRELGHSLLSFATNGTLTLNTVSVDPDGTLDPTLAWHMTSLSSFISPPVRIGGLVAGIGTDGKLYTYDLQSQNTVLSGAAVLASGASSAAMTAMEVIQRPNSASVTFLLDGEEYFPTMRNVLIAVLNGSFATPASLPADVSFEGLIKAIGSAGHNAYVMMWNTSIAYAMTDIGNWANTQIATTLGAVLFQKLFDTNGAFKGDHRLNAQTALGLKGASNVSVYLENYQAQWPNWYPLPAELGSNHQKIVIASVNGTRIALVSGFNTITPSYYDSKAHTMLDQGGNYDGASWHDTGLALTGPAVDLIEAEFDRRWSKANSKPAPSGNTYVKVANWMIARNSIIGPAGTPPPYVSPLPSTPQVPAQVAITCNERMDLSGSASKLQALLTDVHQILDQLIVNINKATSYIYFENFTFTSSEIVAALAARLISQPASFRVIVMVPHPTVSEYRDDFTIEQGQLKLIRYAYAALKLASQDWDYYALQAGDIITSQDTTSLNFDPRGIEYTTVTFTKGGTTRRVWIHEVWNIHDSATQPQVCFCSPARYFATPPSDTGKALQGQPANYRGIYVHSKLALFDDRVAVVGSANFSPRSLRMDGEMSVFINDSATALGIRQRLFQHWGMTTPSAWWNDANSYATTTTNSVGVLPLRYSALPQKPVSYTWSFLTTFVDPSQFL